MPTILLWCQKLHQGFGRIYAKGSLGYYNFKSKTLQDEFSPEGLCKAAMFALLVKEELQSWPEKATRQRRWLTIPEALDNCRHPWMHLALEEGFIKWLDNWSTNANNDDDEHWLTEVVCIWRMNGFADLAPFNLLSFFSLVPFLMSFRLKAVLGPINFSWT